MNLLKLWKAIHHLLDDGDGIALYIDLNDRYSLMGMDQNDISLEKKLANKYTETFGIDMSNMREFAKRKYGHLEVDDHKIIKEILK